MARSSLHAFFGRFLPFLRSKKKPPDQPARRRQRPWLWLERLEDRLAPVADVFTNPLGGAWAVGSNWSLFAPPTSSQDATVTPGSSVTVTHAMGTDTVHTLTSDGSLLVSGGSLSVTGDIGGTVNVSGSGQLLLSGTGSTDGNVNIDLSSGATVTVSGSLANTGNTLTVSGSGTLVLSGTLTGGTVSLSNGATMVGQAGTLDGVALNGAMTVSGNNDVVIENGLTLNGTLTLGDSTGFGYLDFVGTQTLGGSGSVVFGSGSGGNALLVPSLSDTLTIGPSVSVHGQSGYIGYDRFLGGAASDTIVNQGTIDADTSGGTIFLTCIYEGSGTYGNANGGVLNMSGATLNGVTLNGTPTVSGNNDVVIENGLTLNGTLTLGDSTGFGYLDFVGTQTLGGSGSVVFGSGSGGNALLVPSPSDTLTIGPSISVHGQSGYIGYDRFLGGAANDTIVNQGTIDADTSGGTIFLTCIYEGSGTYGNANGGVLNMSGATLNGVTLNGTPTVSGNNDVVIENGLTLNGTLTLGDSTGFGYLDFVGTQTLGGSGSVVFGSGSGGNALLVPSPSDTLTIGPSISVHGQSGYIGYDRFLGGAASDTIVNQGTIDADTSGGTIFLTCIYEGSGTYGNANGGVLNMSGATLNGVTLNGMLNLSGATLNGVTLNGTPTVSGNNDVVIENGLTLNGTLTLGDSTGFGYLDFVGTQTLGGSGSVVFGSGSGGNALLVPSPSDTLTIGPSISVHGQSGYIGYDRFLGGAASDTIVNQGTIDADTSGGTIFLTCIYEGSGTYGNANGGVLNMSGATLNGVTLNGMLNLSGATLNGVTLNGTPTVSGNNDVVIENGLTLNGTLTLGDSTGFGYLDFVGTQTLGGSGSVVFGSGSGGNALLVPSPSDTLTIGPSISVHGQSGYIGCPPFLGGAASVVVINDGTITADVSGGTIYLESNTYQGGTYGSANGGMLSIANATLDGVTLNGAVTVTSNDGAFIEGGLTLNGTATLGDSTSGAGGYLYFEGTQTLAGTGSVVFASSNSYNALAASNSTTLTIGPNITVQGQSGYVGYDPTVGGGSSVTVINQGTISADTGGDTISIGGISSPASIITGILSASNGGSISSPGSLQVNGSGLVTMSATSSLTVSGNLLGTTQDSSLFNPQGVVTLNGSGTLAAPQQLEVMSEDIGNVVAGYQDNFAYGTLVLSNSTYVQLVDNAVNSAGTTGPEALYVNTLVVPAGTTLDLNGLHVYARLAEIAGTVLGGTVNQLPSGGPLFLNSPAAGNIQTAGAVDSWTFFGLANQTIAVVVNTGNHGSVAPQPPDLNYAQIQILDPNGNVIDSATNSQSGADVTLLGVTLPADGTYTVQVQAPSNQPSITGDYIITAWNAPLNDYTLNLGQIVTGRLASPYAADNWNFSAAANEQVKFNLINSSNSAVQFDLTGPNGYTAFSGASSGSNLINLPTAGSYTLTVYTTEPTEGAYSFEMQETSVTPLTSGVAYDGVFAGSGQLQLFTITTPQDRELLIALHDTNAGDQNEVSASYGAPPTRADFQYESIVPGSGSQTVLVPTAAPGTWYILVYADNVAAPPADYTLTATVSPVDLTAVTPDRLGNAADAVLTLTGAGFDSTTTVSLVAAGGTSYQANQTQLDLPTQLTATFTAGTVPAGVYSVAVTRADGFSATLPSAFTMDQGGAANFHANLVTPSSLGYHIASTLYLQYSNTGDLAMPAPILEVTITQTHSNGTTTQVPLLTLDSSIATQGLWTSSLPAGFSNTIQVLASGATPGVLEPGESEQIPIYYAGWEQPWDFSYPVFQPVIGLEQTTDTTPIPWSIIQSSFQPPTLTTAAWNAVFPSVEALVGNTWGDYVQALDNAGTYLASLGENVTDISQLWSFVIQEATGFSVVQTLSSMTDAQVASPGPALSVDRTFPNYIDTRATLGPFGYGWNINDEWKQSLTVASDGTVNIMQDGMPNIFEPDTRGGYFEMAGYNDTLTAESGRAFLLQDADGQITAFNGNGTVNYIEDTNGNTVTAGYTNGLLTSLTASTGQTLDMVYNSAGRITSITDSTGRTTTYAYDSTNQYLLSVTDFAGMTTYYTYDTNGPAATQNALLSVQNPDGTIDEFTYNAEGQLASTYTTSVAVPSLDTMQVTYAYGPEGVVGVTDADGGTTQYFFDNRGLTVKVVDPLGNATHYIYNNNYNLTEVIDPAGQITTYAYDQNGNLIQSTNPDGGTVNYTYAGPFNNLTSYTDSNGNTTNYAYNSQGDLLSITYPNQTEQRFGYNPVGDLTETINGNGQAINSTYNSMGLVTEEQFADGTTATYTYDAHGNMLTATNSTGTTTFRYDPVTENLLEVSYPGGFTLTFTYDSAGRRMTSVDQSGFTVNYSYNSAGLLAGLTDGNGNLIVSYTYDAAGNLILKDMGNGTYTTYQYDLAGNLLNLVNYAPGGSVNSSFNYTYNSLDLQTSMTTLDGVWTYQYDPAGQLAEAMFASNNAAVVPNQSLQYIYDAAGNRTETIINGVTTLYVTNDMNQYTQVGSTTYSYDADGNLITQTDSTGTTTYSYNELNELTGVSSPTSDSTYRYNPLGQLASMTQNGQTTQYVVDPTGLGNVVGEYNGSCALIADYTYGQGLTSQVLAGGQTSYYDFDALGSTVGMSGATGTYQNVYRYLPFGVSLTSSGTIPNPFQFVGQFGVMTQLNGLDFMRARFYSSNQGQFLSRDPLGLAGGQTNLYVYSGQNPIVFIDPSGLSLFDLCYDVNRVKELEAALASADLALLDASLWLDEHPTPQATVALRAAQAYVLLIQLELSKIKENFPPCPNPPPTPSPCPPGNTCTGGTMPNSTGPGTTGDPPLSCSVSTPNPGSMDPNSATGPDGYGPQGFIAPNTVLPYRIDFENAPTATAPAQAVVVTDQLDPNLDWSTFQLTEVGFGDNIITIPAGSQHFQTTVPMTYNDQTFNVEIELGLNVQTGLLTATFQSIDPNTNLPPNVLIGFLPPEDGTGRGMGYFSYTIMANPGLPTGTQIHNVAVITFDDNPPIATDQVNDYDASRGIDPTKQDLNTIDAGPLTSSVTALPMYSPASFTVSWSGQDNPLGSGIAAYYVYVSDDGGPYTEWQIWNTGTSAVFTGQYGHTYSFYSIAVDNVGNVQPTPTVAQATTTVQASQTISFGPLANQTYGAAPFSVSASASSGLAVGFSIVAGGQYATISGNTITLLGATPTGAVVTVAADQSGNGNYSAAPTVDQSFTIAKANQTINIIAPAPGSATYNTAFNVAATASSDLAVAIAADGVVSSGSGSGSASILMDSGSGTATVTFTQAGNANYNSATAVVESVTAQKANQTITVTTAAPGSATYNTTFNVAATASSGLAVAIAADGFVSSGSGSGSSAILMDSGSGTATVTFTQAGNANYNSATAVVENVTAQKANQTITVTTAAPSTAVYNSTFNVAATVSSGLAVSIAASGSASGSGSGSASILMDSGSGTATVTFTQAGNANYNSATAVVESVTAQKANQTITVTTAAPATAVYNSTFNVAATASSGLAVSIAASGSASGSGSGSASILMDSGAGTATVTFSQAGNANYNSATAVVESVTAQKANQTITVTTAAPATAVYNSTFNVAATASSGLAVSIAASGSASGSGSGSASITITMTTGAGTITFSQTGNANYNAATVVTETVTVNAVTSVRGDVYILNTTASGALNVSGNGQLNAPGQVQVNSSSSTAVQLSGNADVSGASIQIAGGDQVSGNGHFNQTPQTHAASSADPLASVAAPTGGASQGAITLTSGTQTLAPGVYRSITLSGNAHLVLGAGVYIIGSGGISVSENATVSGTGVMIYNAGALTITGNAGINLTAATSGAYANLAIFQARTNAGAVTVSGNANLNLNGGALYAANAQSVVTFTGDAQVEAALVVNELALSVNAIVSA